LDAYQALWASYSIGILRIFSDLQIAGSLKYVWIPNLLFGTIFNASIFTIPAALWI